MLVVNGPVPIASVTSCVRGLECARSGLDVKEDLTVTAAPDGGLVTRKRQVALGRVAGVGAGAPTDPQSRRRYSAVPDYTRGAHPRLVGRVEGRMAVGCDRVGPDPGHRRE